MSFELNQNELQSYEEKYNKILKAKVVLTFNKIKKIIIEQFSISDAQANLILKKVFANQKSDELNREGFFTTLRYIQCLQNGVNIETCNINTIKLSFPLKVNSKKNLKKSFQPNVIDDPLGKSMLALNDLQSLIKQGNQTDQKQNDDATKSKINAKVAKPAEQQNTQADTKQQLIQEPVQIQQQQQEKKEQIQQKNNIIDIDIDDAIQVEQQTKKCETLSNQFPGKQQNGQNEYNKELHNSDRSPKIQQEQNNQEVKIQENQLIQESNDDESNNFKQQQDQKQEMHQTIQKIKNFGDIPLCDTFGECFQTQNMPDVVEMSSDDEDLEKTKEIYVWISGYQFQKEGQLTNYYTYTVCSEILLDQETRSYTKYSVNRRYTDFKMLQDYFTQTKQGELIPSLPEKEGVLGNLMSKVREDTKMLDERKEQLQFFLNNLTRYKEDRIFMSFLTIDKKFNEIIIELRYQSESEADGFLPDPEDFKIAKKFSMALSDYQSMILDYFKGNQEIEAKFQEEYRQVQQHYKNLENKKNELQKFKLQLTQFYEPVQKFGLNQNVVPTQIITEQNVAYAYQTVKIYQSQKIFTQNETMNQVKQIEFRLNSLTYSYQQIQKQIYKWFQNKQKLKNDKLSNLKQIQQSDSEEGRLKFVLDKTNDTLIKLVNEITDDLNSLLKTFIHELTCE